MKEMAVLLPLFRGARTRVRCVAHILNLVVKVALMINSSQFIFEMSILQAILSQFSRNINIDDADNDLKQVLNGLESALDVVGDEEPEIPDSDDTGDELAPDVAASDAAAVSNVIAEAELSDRLDALNATELRLGLLSITKVHFILNFSTRSIIYNWTASKPGKQKDLSVSCGEASLSVKQMVRDVSTRWNSTAELIQRALDLKDALNVLVIKAEHNRPRGVRLQRFWLSQAEWTLLAELSPLLEVRLFNWSLN